MEPYRKNKTKTKQTQTNKQYLVLWVDKDGHFICNYLSPEIQLVHNTKKFQPDALFFQHCALLHFSGKKIENEHPCQPRELITSFTRMCVLNVVIDIHCCDVFH